MSHPGRDARHHHHHHPGGDRAHAHGDDLHFDADMAARWEAWAPLLEPATAALSEVLLDAARVGPGTRVVDAACGLGPTTAAAHERRARALGIDLEPTMVERAARRHPDASFRVGDMTDLPAPEGGGEWDAVVCRFGAHHVDSGPWFAHVRSVLRPGGRLAIAEWGVGDEVPLFAHAADHEHAHAAVERDPDAWAGLLRAAGFTDVSVQRVDVPLAFEDDATWRRFLVAMNDVDEADAARVPAHLDDGVQHNAAYVVAGTA